MRGFQYIRVSDEEQAVEGYSITAQKALLDRKFAEWGATVAGVYIDDGYSAKDIRRPDLQRLMNDIATLKPDFIAFWKLDRWTRAGRDWHALNDKLKPYGVTLRSAIGENLSEGTAFERFNVGLNVLLGQFEREQISERVHFVMMERHNKGLRNGAKPPYGYDLKNGQLIVNEEQAEVVRKIFNWYAYGDENGPCGFREIAVKLNRGNGREWTYSSVRYALMNPVYCGKLRWNYRKASGKPTGKEIIVDSDHAPIIPVELFEKVYGEIVSRKRGGKAATSEYAFSGVLRCGRCGKAMVGFSRGARFYRCTGRANAGTCDMPAIHSGRLEQAFLASLDYDSDQVRNLIDVPDRSDEVKSRREALEAEIEQIRKRKKKWQMAYADDVISLEDLRERTKEDAEREKEISQELATLPQGTSNVWSKEMIADILVDAKKAMQSADEAEKKAFIRELFERVTVDAEKPEGKPAPGRYSMPVIIELVPRQSKSYL
ncbi:recombinase family protein [Paenibacillus naphthalenovorans]|uniref:recombinase family protein n=1 Tax=Paenibacillus naphthalenovorans TaxID=162209 RepID=UPI003D2A3F24